MLPELALICLLLIPILALWSGLLPWLPARSGAVRLAPALSLLLVLLTATSLLLLAYSFLHDDFTLRYVAQHSNSRLPWPFKLAAVWGGHEGSLLFFLFALTLWNLRLWFIAQPVVTKMRAQSIMGWLIMLISLFLLAESNPFTRVFPPPFEGRDLNPMLQDIALILHPPLLYLGYVGFAASFALGITALWEQRLDTQFVKEWRPLTRTTWGWLTAGIALGAWWAYHELGWGGWWFWDPVENASLLPWLLGTALLHAQLAFMRNGSLRHTLILLALVTFLMSLLGTFIVRAGIMGSVHAFSAESGRNNALLLILGLSTLAALLIYGWRSPFLSTSDHITPQLLHPHSSGRENGLRIAVLLPVIAAVVVMLGTFYPLFYALSGSGTLSVGAPYFNLLFVPLVFLCLLALIVFPAIRNASGLPPIRAWLWLLLALPLVFWINGTPHWHTLTAFIGSLMAVWLILTTLQALWFDKLKRGHLAHLALAITVLGASQLAGYSHERGALLSIGQSVSVGQYELRLDAITPELGPNFTAERYHLTALQNGKVLGNLYPERRHYSVRAMQMNETGILPLGSGDLYAVPGEKRAQQIALRVAHKPGSRWLWLGGILLTIAGLLPLRRRKTADECNEEAVCPE
nr:heme lyase NrfEFG subunit NrfE [Plesiomonas shigelloides]